MATFPLHQEPSWWYGSWIYNYLCYQWLSLLTVVSSNRAHGEVYSIQHVIKFVSDVRQVGGFLRGLRFPPPPRYSRNVVESGVKHHNPIHYTSFFVIYI
jgi:hypothetical protein